MAAYLKDPNFLHSPKVHALLEELTWGRPDYRPDMPPFLCHSTTDQLLPFEAAFKPTLDKYCVMGVDLRFFEVPVSEHIGADVFST